MYFVHSTYYAALYDSFLSFDFFYKKIVLHIAMFQLAVLPATGWAEVEQDPYGEADVVLPAPLQHLCLVVHWGLRLF
jgi:hypothetical protein